MAVTPHEPLSPRRMLLSGWGGTPRSSADVYAPNSARDVAPLLACPSPGGSLARGLGRSYGDAALNAGGAVLDMNALTGIHALDVESGTVRVAGGTSFDWLIRTLMPLGFFVPVTPGTRFVTVGGAIAADIHGKNHHVDGSLQDYVDSFELVLPSGQCCEVSRESHPDLFAATCGGLGLTGVITAATIRLLGVETSYMRLDSERLPNLDAAFERFMDSDDANYRYSVAWIDCMAGGGALGRSVLLRANHATIDDLPKRAARAPFALKEGLHGTWYPWLPQDVLRGWSIRAFNEVMYRWWLGRGKAGSTQNLLPYFYPLDWVAHWNRAYGARGFVQYQFVVPYGQEEAVRTAIERLSRAGYPSFLAVLKRMGPGHGMLSFPAPGWTLALDIPAGVSGLAELLDDLDRVVLEAGGRIYLAKDARMRPELVPEMYPDFERFRDLRRRIDPEGRMRSDLARRLNLL